MGKKKKRGGPRCGVIERANNRQGEDRYLLWTIAVVRLVLWALGLVSNYTVGGFIHLLLVADIVMVLVRIIQGHWLTWKSVVE